MKISYSRIFCFTGDDDGACPPAPRPVRLSVSTADQNQQPPDEQNNGITVFNVTKKLNCSCPKSTVTVHTHPATLSDLFIQFKSIRSDITLSLVSASPAVPASVALTPPPTAASRTSNPSPLSILSAHPGTAVSVVPNLDPSLSTPRLDLVFFICQSECAVSSDSFDFGTPDTPDPPVGPDGTIEWGLRTVVCIDGTADPSVSYNNLISSA